MRTVLRPEVHDALAGFSVGAVPGAERLLGHLDQSQWTRAGDPQVDDLDQLLAAILVTVGPLVRIVEGIERLRDRLLRQLASRHRHGQLGCHPDIAHVGGPIELHVALGDILFLGQRLADASLDLDEQLVHLSQLELILPHRRRPDTVLSDVGCQGARYTTRDRGSRG